MNGDNPNLTTPLGKFDPEADSYFKGLTTPFPGSMSAGPNTNTSSFFTGRQTFPSTPMNNVDEPEVSSSKHLQDAFIFGPDNLNSLNNMNNVNNISNINNIFSGSAILATDTENGNWPSSLADGRKSNGSGNYFDAFSSIKGEPSMGMDFAPGTTTKNTNFSNSDLMGLPSIGFSEAPPGFSSSKKSRWLGEINSASQSSSINNGFSVSPMSENILSSSSNDPERPGSTTSASRMGSSSGYVGNWGSKNMGAFSLLDFVAPMNGFNKTALFVADINNIFRNFVRTRLVDSVNKCQDNFEFLSNLIHEDIIRIRETWDEEEAHVFEHIYNTLKNNYTRYCAEKLEIEESYSKFEFIISCINKHVEHPDSDELQLKNNLMAGLQTVFGTCSLENYNPFFMNFAKFYKKMFNFLPDELTDHMMTIRELSTKATALNGKQTTAIDDPLLRSYITFINELKHHKKTRKAVKDLNNNKNAVDNSAVNGDTNGNGAVGVVGESVPSVQSNGTAGSVNGSDEHQPNDNEVSVVENCQSPALEKKVEKEEVCRLPVFYNIEELKNEESIYMPYYYPVDTKSLNFDGAIPQLTVEKHCNAPVKDSDKDCVYSPPGKQLIEHVIDGELNVYMPGNVVFEDVDDENVYCKKSFVKLISKLHHHFPNLDKKQLAEIVIQSKYALVKKDKYHYGFSGMKMKNIVRLVAEFIQENAITTTAGQSIAPGNVCRNGPVSWSKIASST